MEKFIADKITDWCLKHNSVSEIQEVAIRYGIELYLDSFIKIILIFCLGLICGKGVEVVIVIGSFCTLRSQAGGIHMKSSAGCFFSMVIITLISVVGAEIFVPITIPIAISLIIISLTILYFCAPYSTYNNPITDKKVIRLKKCKAMILTILLGVVACISKSVNLRALILIPVIIEIITILPFWRRKEVSVNDNGKLSDESR